MSKAPGACRIAQLSDPHLPGVLPGVELTAPLPLTSPAYFSCCGGSGMRLATDTNVTVACQLGQRLKLLRRIERQWRETAADEFARTWGLLVDEPRQLFTCRQRLSLIAAQRSMRGLAWTRQTETSQPAEPTSAPTLKLSAWLIAVSAAWRFGLRPHVVILGASKAGEILPAANNEAPQIICVGNVDGLWEPHTAEQLETLAAYAYGSMIPLFMEMAPRQQQAGQVSAESGPQRTRDYFARRLAGIKAKSPLAWLPPATVDKLATVTDGLAGYVAAARQERAAGQPRAPRPVRLPWDRP